MFELFFRCLLLISVGRESQYAKTAKNPSEEAVSDCEGQSPLAGRAQQSYSCPKQAGEFVSRAAETQQDIKGTPQSLIIVLYFTSLLSSQTLNTIYSWRLKSFVAFKKKNTDWGHL